MCCTTNSAHLIYIIYTKKFRIFCLFCISTRQKCVCAMCCKSVWQNAMSIFCVIGARKATNLLCTHHVPEIFWALWTLYSRGVSLLRCYSLLVLCVATRNRSRANSWHISVSQSCIFFVYNIESRIFSRTLCAIIFIIFFICFHFHFLFFLPKVMQNFFGQNF